MAVKAHILIYRWAIGGMGKYFLAPSMRHPVKNTNSSFFDWVTH